MNIMKTLLLFTLLIGASAIAQDYPDDCMDALVIPESFTPNADGAEDVFKMDFPCPTETFSIKIYDRWGSEVYKSDDYKFEWDGTSDDKPLEGGVYIWSLDFTFNGGEFNQKGNVKLVK